MNDLNAYEEAQMDKARKPRGKSAVDRYFAQKFGGDGAAYLSDRDILRNKHLMKA